MAAADIHSKNVVAQAVEGRRCVLFVVGNDVPGEGLIPKVSHVMRYDAFGNVPRRLPSTVDCLLQLENTIGYGWPLRL